MNIVRAAQTLELRNHHLFSALNESQYAAVLDHVHVRGFVGGQRIFDQGDAAGAFFMVQRGSIKLYRVSALGQEKVMLLVSGGDSFAESVMFMDAPRYPVNAEGVAAGTLVSIDAAAYVDVLRGSFAACRGVMSEMTRRIQCHWDEIEALTLQNGRYRVVHYLLGLVPDGAQGEIRTMLPSRKALIATQLALAPETLSRILHGLNDEGLIETRDYAVRIPDVVTLRQCIAAPGAAADVLSAKSRRRLGKVRQLEFA